MMKQKVTLCEVGPRDGLQNHPRQFSISERIEMIDRLSMAGLPRIEAVSFVNDAKVPGMSGAESVLKGIARPGGTEFSGLVLNRRGAERALNCELDEIRLVVVASDTFSQRNQGATLAQMLSVAGEVATMVTGCGRRFAAVIATAFGCPFEGRIDPAQVAAIAGELRAAGAAEIVLADTIGAATPFEVAAIVPLVAAAAGDAILGCHFHNTRNMGFANAYVAIEKGVRLLDSSIGGLGGCPFAPRATGNIATEDLVYMLGAERLDQPLDTDRLFAAIDWIEGLVGKEVPGLLRRAGLFPAQSAA